MSPGADGRWSDAVDEPMDDPTENTCKIPDDHKKCAPTGEAREDVLNKAVHLKWCCHAHGNGSHGATNHLSRKRTTDSAPSLRLLSETVYEST